jgi:ABC-type antimicrobial peptide transport system permease subunit
MALLLACLGVLGLVSYGMTLRTRELGIRMALGAGRQSLVSALLRRLARPAFWGAVAGIVVALAAAKALEGEPLYLIPADLRAYAGALLILFAAAGTAASIPVIRALRSDPLKSLRHD